MIHQRNKGGRGQTLIRATACGAAWVCMAAAGLPIPTTSQAEAQTRGQRNRDDVLPGRDSMDSGGRANQPERATPVQVQNISPEERARILRQRQERREQLLNNGQPDTTAAQVGVGNGDILAEGAVVGDLAGEEGMIRLEFAEPIDYITLLQLVANTLGINIIIDPSLQGRQVIFQAPVEIPASQLLEFVGSLLDGEGFVIQRDPLGHYLVDPIAEVRVNPGETTEVFSSALLRPSALQDAVTQWMGAASPETSRVRFAALDDVGLLVVTAPPKTLSNVRQIIERIRSARADLRLTRFPLQYVSAGFARERVLELAGEIAAEDASTGTRTTTVGRTRPPLQNPGNPNQAAGSTGQGLGAGATSIGERLSIDRQGNALLFRGTPEEAALVSELIETADRVSPLVAQRYLAGPVLEDVLLTGEALGLGSIERISAQSGGSSRNRFAQRGVNTANQGEAPLGGSRFQVNDTNGSFIYFGTPAQHARVAELVDDFRASAVDEEIVIEVYKLQYARAGASGGAGLGGGGGGSGDSGGLSGAGSSGSSSSGGGSGGDDIGGIAEILEDLIASPERDTTNAPFLPQSPAERAAAVIEQGLGIDADSVDTSSLLVANEQNTTIVADEPRNQIIIRAPKAAQTEFARLIEKLDQRRPQVLIEATIVTLEVSDTFDFALDFAVNANVNSGLFQLFSGGQTTDGPGDPDLFNFPDGVPSGGLSVGLLDTEIFRFGLRALEQDTDGRVLSRPQMVVNDNELASLVSEDVVPYAETRFDDNGEEVVTQGGTATAGTRLQVRPQIGGGGDLILSYYLELSAFGDSITPNLQPPESREEYQSTVTLPSDTTLVVGGLEFTSDLNTDGGIPGLKDLPLVGPLFSDISRSRSRQRIYVFITPRILQDENFQDLRLLGEYPMVDAQIQGEWPDLEPAVIPITPYVPLDARLLRENTLSDTPPVQMITEPEDAAGGE